MFYRPSSRATSYEDLSNQDHVEEVASSHVRAGGETEGVAGELMELKPQTSKPLIRRASKMVRQASVMETNLDGSGAMQMTYWF